MGLRLVLTEGLYNLYNPGPEKVGFFNIRSPRGIFTLLPRSRVLGKPSRSQHVAPLTLYEPTTPKVRFSASLGEEPEIELACVMVSKCTENGWRFSARLDDGLPEVRFEPAVWR
jgi:hypothetical protein